MMELLLDTDTTSLSYWLNWRFLLCVIWVCTPMVVAAVLICKYEGSYHSKSEKEATQQERAWFLYEAEAWMPCVKEIHPAWLMVFRIIAFFVLLVAATADVIAHGSSLFYYYTQWTFTLVIIYFGLGSILSIYGCSRYHKTSNDHVMRLDAENGMYVPLTSEEAGNSVRNVKNSSQQGKFYVLQTAAFWGYVLQIMFQMTAGAVMLTDSVYWCVIFPFLTVVNYEMNFLTVVAHSLNAVLLLGDTALNCLRFPWFRISYFILLTGFYVIFEWAVHACISLWWPYPFLDLSLQLAPLWYLIVAVLHIPCYVIFALIVRAKLYVLSKWFPQSNQCLR